MSISNVPRAFIEESVNGGLPFESVGCLRVGLVALMDLQPGLRRFLT